jgi:Asp-tRNA(Asn)/Glu-tRNA(Gln) amidotransferase A subunit family amidase
MEPRSIEDWMTLAACDPRAWHRILKRRLQHCQRTSQKRVLCDAFIPHAPSPSGPLAGVPFVIKDLFDRRGHSSPCGSILPPFLEYCAESDAEIVSDFEALGASCCGKTQLNEFAYGLSGENPHYGNCHNPLDPSRLSGGSSSGSAWMVARGIVPLAMATDTGGSIRVPAAWCGIYGIRWQPGQWLGGCYPLAAEFDTAGWFTATARDMAISLQKSDCQTSAVEADHCLNGLACIPADSVDPTISEPLAVAINGLGLARDDKLLSSSFLQASARAFNILQSRQAYAHHQLLLEQWGQLYDPAVRARLLRGRDWSVSEVQWARTVQVELSQWLDSYFSQYSIFCLPACPQSAPKISRASDELREKTLALTALASLSGKPVLTLPVCLDARQSVGLQCIFSAAESAIPLQILARF